MFFTCPHCFTPCTSLEDKRSLFKNLMCTKCFNQAQDSMVKYKIENAYHIKNVQQDIQEKTCGRCYEIVTACGNCEQYDMEA